MTSLSVFCYPQYSQLLIALQSIDDPSNIIETGATHRGNYVLVYRGEATDALRTNATEFSTLKNVHAGFLPAYFKQKPIRVEKNLVCVEGERLSSLFEAVNTVLGASDFECIEINRGLDSKSLAFALFANGADMSVFENLGWVQVTRIENPGPAIKKYF